MWKQINRLHSASSDGSIRNDVTNKILKGDLNSKGYPRVTLLGEKYFVHILIATLFVPNPENKPQVNHIDHNKLNNAASNLNWMTNAENNKYSYTHNNRINPKAIIDKYQVREIRILLSTISINQLAEWYGVKPVTIQAIKYGHNWKNV